MSRAAGDPSQIEQILQVRFKVTALSLSEGPLAESSLVSRILILSMRTSVASLTRIGQAHNVECSCSCCEHIDRCSDFRFLTVGNTFLSETSREANHRALCRGVLLLANAVFPCSFVDPEIMSVITVVMPGQNAVAKFRNLAYTVRGAPDESGVHR